MNEEMIAQLRVALDLLRDTHPPYVADSAAGVWERQRLKFIEDAKRLINTSEAR